MSFDISYTRGRMTVSRQLLEDAGLVMPDPMRSDPVADWWRPLAPWRIARTIKARAACAHERLADVVYVARHGIPDNDEW